MRSRIRGLLVVCVLGGLLAVAGWSAIGGLAVLSRVPIMAYLGLEVGSGAVVFLSEERRRDFGFVLVIIVCILVAERFYVSC